MREAKAEANRRWRVNNPDYYAKKRLADLTALGPRFCEECGDQLPVESQRAKKFCSRKCINAKSIREKTEARLVHNRKARAVRFGAEAMALSERDWLRLVNRLAGMCGHCGVRPYYGMDHVVPLRRGGRHSIGNVLPCCRNCNVSKGSMLMSEWKRTRGYHRLVLLPKRSAA